MKIIQYQQKAVLELSEKTISMMELSGSRHTLVFKAPTGSGKTVMASMMLERIEEEVECRCDLAVKGVAFVWIAPNKLHEQSYFKMKGYFSETRILKPVMYDELDQSDGVLHEREILFVNWESVNKENNVMVRESENHRSLYEIIENTKRERGVPVVVVIDEEHLFWNKKADRSEQVLKSIDAKVEVRISATPRTQGEQLVNVPRDVVIKEEMIKEGVILNPVISEDYQQGLTLTQNLLEKALKKRNELAAAYKKINVDINPLLLIQLPNDKTESLSSDETKLVDTIEGYLKYRGDGCSVDNGKMAVWLSGRKDNLKDIENPNSMVDVLLFKQAIALGWDCPRAAVLLIFRDIKSCEFTIQTVGRILRMPEQKFYENGLLNKGYVYTDLSKEIVKIVADDMNYMTTIVANRREALNNVCLKSVYQEYKSEERNRLGKDFKKILTETFVNRWRLQQQEMDFSFDTDELPFNNELVVAQNRQWAEHYKVKFNVRSIAVEIPENVILNTESDTDLRNHKSKFARTVGEVKAVFVDFCRGMLTSFEKVHSTDVLVNYLTEVMEELFQLDEWDAMKVVLYYDNKEKFRGVIRAALDRYSKVVQERQKEAKKKEYKEREWQVPMLRTYNEESNEVVESVKNHAVEPFVRLKETSKPELEFERYLESYSEYIDWWYKNGDSGRDNYAIGYVKKDGNRGLFYVDFIIRMKSGRVYLFDTKTMDSDENAVEKHNALIDYINNEENKDKNLRGGVLIQEGELWRYSPFHIDNMKDKSNWNTFYPNVN